MKVRISYNGKNKEINISKKNYPNGLVLGRSETADLQIKIDSLSRKHVKIYTEGESLMAMDLGSTNGCHLNDEKLVENQPVQLTTFFDLKVGPDVTVRLLDDL